MIRSMKAVPESNCSSCLRSHRSLMMQAIEISRIQKGYEALRSMRSIGVNQLPSLACTCLSPSVAVRWQAKFYLGIIGCLQGTLKMRYTVTNTSITNIIRRREKGSCLFLVARGFQGSNSLSSQKTELSKYSENP